jgi:hypothetical protein
MKGRAGPDDHRTKALKKSLEAIWKKLDLGFVVFKQFPFDPSK